MFEIPGEGTEGDEPIIGNVEWYMLVHSFS